MLRRATVAPTDRRWFDHLRRIAEGGRLPEVNFWRPKAQTDFNALSPGEPLFFRLKSPVNAVAGYGFFAIAVRLPIREAWDVFGEANGDASFESFLRRIAEYRKAAPEEVLQGRKELACIILREARFLPEERWLRWTGDRDWHPNLMSYKAYDLDHGPGPS
jgi:putative restriction endonuclease